MRVVSIGTTLKRTCKEYCSNAGMKPVSQTNFNKKIEANYLAVQRIHDKMSRRHIWDGIAYCEGGKDA